MPCRWSKPFHDRPATIAGKLERLIKGTSHFRLGSKAVRGVWWVGGGGGRGRERERDFNRRRRRKKRKKKKKKKSKAIKIILC